MRLDRDAIDAKVPAISDVETGIAGEIAEHEQRHQRDQAGQPKIAPRRHAGRRPHPSRCTGNVRHRQDPCFRLLPGIPLGGRS